MSDWFRADYAAPVWNIKLPWMAGVVFDEALFGTVDFAAGVDVALVGTVFDAVCANAEATAGSAAIIIDGAIGVVVVIAIAAGVGVVVADGTGASAPVDGRLGRRQVLASGCFSVDNSVSIVLTTLNERLCSLHASLQLQEGAFDGVHEFGRHGGQWRSSVQVSNSADFKYTNKSWLSFDRESSIKEKISRI